MTRLLVLAVLTLSAPALAEEPAAAPKPRQWKVALEIDPLPWALGGYDGVLNVTAPALPHWRFGLGGFGIRALPDAAVKMNAANEGFGVGVPWASAANALYYFSDDRGGFFVGPMVMVQRMRFTLAGESAEVTKLAAGGMGGYQWFTFQGLGLYLLPWAGAFGAFNVAGEPTVQGRTYAESPLVLNLAVHLGWEFSL